MLHLVIGETKRTFPLIPGLTFCSVQMDQYHQCHVKLRCMKNGSLAQLFWRNIFSSYRSFLLAGSSVLASPVGWLCMKTDVTCFAIKFNHKLFFSKNKKGLNISILAYYYWQIWIILKYFEIKSIYFISSISNDPKYGGNHLSTTPDVFL